MEPLIVSISETINTYRELYKVILVCGTVVLSFIIYRLLDSAVDDESDSESEEEEEEEESETSGEYVDDELLALEKENAELDEALGKFEEDTDSAKRRK